MIQIHVRYMPHARYVTVACGVSFAGAAALAGDLTFASALEALLTVTVRNDARRLRVNALVRVSLLCQQGGE